MAKRAKRTPAASTPTELCNQLHGLGNQAIDALDGWDPDNAVTTNAAVTALRSAQSKAEEILKIARRTGGFTAAQREAIDHAATFVALMWGITGEDDAIELTPDAELQLWPCLNQICNRLSPKAS